MLSMSFNRSRSAVSWNQSNAKIHEDAKIQKFMRMQKFMDFRELTWPEGTWTWVSPPCSWHAQHFSMPPDQAKIWMFMWKCKKTCLCSWILPVSQLLSLVPVPQLLPHWISLDMWWNSPDIDLNEKINMTKISLSCLVPNTGWRSQCRRFCLIHENW